MTIRISEKPAQQGNRSLAADTAARGSAGFGERRSSRWQRLLTSAAQDWHLPRGAIAVILIVPFVVLLIGFVTLLMGKDTYKWFVQEDGVAENLQALAFALACVFAALTARGLRQTGDSVAAGIFLLMAVGLFFVTGEEISWGQRVLDLQTPEALEEINRQRELNVHNIYPVEYALRLVQLFVGAWAALLPLILLQQRHRFAKWRRTLSYIVPHYTLVVYFGCTMLWRALRLVWPTPPRRFAFVVAEWSEVIELNLAVGVLLFLVYQWRRARADAIAVTANKYAENGRLSA